MEAIREPVITSVIKSRDEYRELLEEFKKLVLLDPPANTPEEDRLELLALLIQDYEAKQFKFEPIDAIETLLYHMDQQGLTRNDLIPYLGSRSKVSEVLNRKRPLTLKMIRALHEGLGISADSLIR